MFTEIRLFKKVYDDKSAEMDILEMRESTSSVIVINIRTDNRLYKR
jgi:hypothetical protein